MAPLAKKVAIITGSNSGIGAATAIKFAQLGCSLTLTGRNVENLRQVESRCLEQGASKEKLHLVIGDMTQDEIRQKIVDETVAKFGQLDILINNAGEVIPGKVPLDVSQLLAFDHLMNVNVRSLVFLTAHAIPYLLKTKGTIVNVSSITGLKPMKERLFYNMTKAAVDMFTKGLAMELGPQGVRVNSLNPGTVITGIQTKAGMNQEQIDHLRMAFSKDRPLGGPAKFLDPDVLDRKTSMRNSKNNCVRFLPQQPFIAENEKPKLSDSSICMEKSLFLWEPALNKRRELPGRHLLDMFTYKRPFYGMAGQPHSPICSRLI